MNARENPRAGRAAAAFLERSRIAGEPGVAQVEPAARGERRAGARGASRQHAVEHVDPARDHLEDALRIAEPHEVPRPVGGKQRRRPGDRVEHLGSALADREPAERVAVERQPDDLLDRASAQLAVDATLRDPEAQLPVRPRRARPGARPRAACGGPPPRARAATRPRAGRCRGTSRCRSRARAGSPPRPRASGAPARRRRRSGT